MPYPQQHHIVFDVSLMVYTAAIALVCSAQIADYHGAYTVVVSVTIASRSTQAHCKTRKRIVLCYHAYGNILHILMTQQGEQQYLQKYAITSTCTIQTSNS
jgi:hypothetical protein